MSEPKRGDFGAIVDGKLAAPATDAWRARRICVGAALVDDNGRRMPFRCDNPTIELSPGYYTGLCEHCSRKEREMRCALRRAAGARCECIDCRPDIHAAIAERRRRAAADRAREELASNKPKGE